MLNDIIVPVGLCGTFKSNMSLCFTGSENSQNRLNDYQKIHFICVKDKLDQSAKILRK